MWFTAICRLQMLSIWTCLKSCHLVKGEALLNLLSANAFNLVEAKILGPLVELMTAGVPSGAVVKCQTRGLEVAGLSPIGSTRFFPGKSPWARLFRVLA